MKNYRTIILFAGFVLVSMFSFSQEQKIPINEPDYNKPRLFAGFPDKIVLSTDQLNEMMSAPLGRNTNFRLSVDNDLQFQGEVISTASKYNNSIQSVVIRSNSFEGARFTLSRITNTDGSVRYSGRIISFKPVSYTHLDVYKRQDFR